MNRKIVIESTSMLILDQCECVSQLSEAHCSQLPHRVQSGLLLHTAASIKIAANATTRIMLLSSHIMFHKKVKMDM